MKTIITLIFIMLIVGCQKLKYGNVIDKSYHPEWEQAMLLPMSISDGKTTTMIMIPYFVHHNESWSIDVKGIDVKGDSITRTYYVDRSYYDSIQYGNFICVKGMCDDDTAIHKIRQ